MRTLVLLFFVILAPAYAEEKGFLFPTDGNGLLDACGGMVETVDSPSSISALSEAKFAEKIGKVDWCAGYLGAIQEIHIQNEVNLALIGMTGVTLQGPDKATQFALDSLRGPCIPDRAPILQLGRVLVKWLREHPERLHELKSTLTTAAFKDAFPCEQPTPREANNPKTAKPDPAPRN